MSETKPLLLITNRFADNLRVSLPLVEEARCVYCQDLFADQDLFAKAQAMIIRSSIQVDKDFFEKAKSLKFLITATAGFNHIDLAEAQKRGVRVFHCPQTQSLAAAELTIMMLFATFRKWTLANKQIRKGDWQRSLLMGKQVQGSTLGVIGLGRVGTIVAQKALALGMKVVGYDPYIEDSPLSEVTMLGFEELMRSADVVSLHVPKTAETRHMIKKETLEWMNTEATLINMSRGDVVNEADLVQHLIENPEFSAGLDVFAKEPLVLKSPLLSLDNVVLSPHIGASTQVALENSSKISLEMALNLLKGGNADNELPPKAAWFSL